MTQRAKTRSLRITACEAQTLRTRWERQGDRTLTVENHAVSSAFVATPTVGKLRCLSTSGERVLVSQRSKVERFKMQGSGRPGGGRTGQGRPATPVIRRAGPGGPDRACESDAISCARLPARLPPPTLQGKRVPSRGDGAGPVGRRGV